MPDKHLDAAINSVRQAGDYLKKQFCQHHEVSFKVDSTVLLDEDIKAEKIILDTISRSFPHSSFLTEETETKITGDDVWVIDPLCGSYSYLRGVETWSVSVAFISDGKCLLGAVYQPLLDNIFYGSLGHGAFLNRKLIMPSKVENVSDAFISVEHGVFNSGRVNLAALISDIKRLRVGHGSGGELAYVAAGFLDAVIKTDQTLIHFAGGKAIIEAVDGTFVDFNGQPAPTYFEKDKKIDYIACNKFLSTELQSYIDKK